MSLRSFCRGQAVKPTCTTPLKYYKVKKMKGEMKKGYNVQLQELLCQWDWNWTHPFSKHKADGKYQNMLFVQKGKLECHKKVILCWSLKTLNFVRDCMAPNSGLFAQLIWDIPKWRFASSLWEGSSKTNKQTNKQMYLASSGSMPGSHYSIHSTSAGIMQFHPHPGPNDRGRGL